MIQILFYGLILANTIAMVQIEKEDSNKKVIAIILFIDLIVLLSFYYEMFDIIGKEYV